jgi:hypothetical protein
MTAVLFALDMRKALLIEVGKSDENIVSYYVT